MEALAQQVILAPRSQGYYRRRCYYALKDQIPITLEEIPEPPKAELEVFVPGGIVYIDGEWLQLAGGKGKAQRTTKSDLRGFHMTFKPAKPSTKTEADEAQNPYFLPLQSDAALTAYGRLMAMVGLEEVKAEFSKIKNLIDETAKTKGHLERRDLNLVLTGNPGTGKRTIAALYCEFLNKCGVWGASEATLVKVSGFDMKNSDTISPLRDINNNTYSVLLFDAPEQSSKKIPGRALNFFESVGENHVVILTGSHNGVTQFLGGRPHGRWLFKRRLQLPDYNDEQLYKILANHARRHSLELDADQEKYLRIAATRLGRGRGTDNYGNAHDVFAYFESIMRRRSLRMRPLEKSEMERYESAPTLRQKGYTCDGRSCRGKADKSIYGPRFRCTICDNTDFCSICEADSNEPHDRSHPLVVFRIPPFKVKSSRSGRVWVDKISGEDYWVDEDEDETTTEESESGSTNRDEGQETAEISEPPENVPNIITQGDIIGEEPPDIRETSQAWKDLDAMVGLQDVKAAVGELFSRAKTNFYRELEGKEPLAVSMNRVFLGPPGTGKTTVAKLYGQIIADVGLVSTKDMVYKTPADFIDQYIGGSERKTMDILNATIGKVLIIDDAHMFYSGSKTTGTGYSLDKFRVAIIDTIVSQLHNRPGEDRCVILLGYPDMMEEMYQNINAGFRRRFPLEEAFRFHDYKDTELLEILNYKMAREEITATPAALGVAAEVLRRARDRPNFGNGGDVENLLGLAKTRFKERIIEEREKSVIIQDDGVKVGDDGAETSNKHVNQFMLPADVLLQNEDFDPEWDRGSGASSKCEALFKDLLGFEGIISKLKGYQQTAHNLRRNGKNPRDSIPFNFVFKGPPGTGKTHTARIVGQIFYDMGFLSTPEVIECSASQLVGQFLGQTGPTVVNMFERALGKVLFIDEAYRLGGGSAGGSRFHEEAVGEIVDCMTKPRFHKKMIIVLAGYTKDIDSLLKTNAGLRSRFATDVVFPSMTPVRARQHLFNLLRKNDIGVVDAPKSMEQKEKLLKARERVLRMLDKLGMTAGWAGARDIGTLAAIITEKVYRTADDSADDISSDEGRTKSEMSVSAAASSAAPSSVQSLKFKISTRDLIDFLKDMLRERINSGMTK